MQAGVLTWLLLTSPHFELYTSSGEKAGRAALQRFEQIRRVMPPVAGPTPLVFLSSSENSEPFLSSSRRTGAFLATRARGLIVLKDPAERVIFHEYAHFVAANTRQRGPLWYEEGEAEYWSALGGPIPEHTALLARRGWSPFDEWRFTTAETPHFYAQSWTVVHLMKTRAACQPLETVWKEAQTYKPTARPLSVDRSPVAVQVRSVTAAEAETARRRIERGVPEIPETPEPPRPPVERKPPVTLPPGWRNPQGDSRIEGVLEEVECRGALAVLRVSGRRLAVREPRRVAITGMTFEFPCGPQKRLVTVEYLAREDPTLQTAGDVTAIEFR